MLWIDDWEFCEKYDCRDSEIAFGLHDRFSARQWLQNFATDVHRMITMRRLLGQENAGPAIVRMSDDEVIDSVVELLVSKRLHIHSQVDRPAASGQTSTETLSPKTERLVPFPISERKPRVSNVSVRQMPDEADSPTFPSNIDFAAQTATLAAAAETGAAACYI